MEKGNLLYTLISYTFVLFKKLALGEVRVILNIGFLGVKPPVSEYRRSFTFE